MKKWLLHIWMISALCVLVASCVTDDDFAEYNSQENNETVTVKFTIALNEANISSRSTWDDDYDPCTGTQREIGLEAENYIDLNNVQVVLYDLNGRLMQKLENVKAVGGTGTNKHIYNLKGSFKAKSDEVSNLSFKMMVFANCPTISNLNDFFNLKYNYDGWSLSQGIPMWGIGTFRKINLTNSTSEDEQILKELDTPIYMLRSMAKIEVALNTEDGTAANYNLTSAELNKVMNAGMAVPAFKNEAGETLSTSALEATTALSIEGVFNPASGNTTTGTCHTFN